MNDKLNRYLQQDLTWEEIALLLNCTVEEAKKADIYRFVFKEKTYDRLELRQLLKKGFEDFMGVSYPEIWNPEITVLKHGVVLETYHWNIARNGVEHYLNEFRI